MEFQPRFARARGRGVAPVRSERVALEAIEDMRMAVDCARRERAFRGAQLGVRG